MDTEFKHIEYKQLKKHAEIILREEDRRNALSMELMQELTGAIRLAGAEPSAQLLVISARGPVFCAGADLKYLSAHADPESYRNYAQEVFMMLKTISLSPVPVLTLVNGSAFGGGLGIIAASDMVFSIDSARFSFSEIKLGLVPAIISPWIFRKIPVSKAGEMMLTGRGFDASEAIDAGLVHHVFKGGEFLKQTSGVASSFYENAPGATREIKQLLIEQEDFANKLTEKEAYLVEKFTKTLSGEEARKGLKAFMDNTKIEW